MVRQALALFFNYHNMKIRLGNDIQIKFTPRISEQSSLNDIKEIKCFLVNTSVLDYNPKAMLCPKRFPGNCCHRHSCCCGGPCGCGAPTYFVEPCMHCIRYPYTPANPAFGEGCLPPKYPGCDCCCDAPYNRYGCFDERAKCSPWYAYPQYKEYISPCFDDNFRYAAKAELLPEEGKAKLYFPAKEQFLCGDYKLIVTVVTEDEGWGKCNSRTYTTDYGTVFTLVDDESGTDEGIIELE